MAHTCKTCGLRAYKNSKVHNRKCTVCNKLFCHTHPKRQTCSSKCSKILKKRPYDRYKNLPTCDICGGRIRGDSTRVHNRECVVCKGPFCDPDGTGKVCSDECFRAYRSQCATTQMKHLKLCKLCGGRKIGKGTKTHNIKCPVCGKRFCATRCQGQVTCSEECRRESQVAKSFPVCKLCGEKTLAEAGSRHN